MTDPEPPRPSQRPRSWRARLAGSTAQVTRPAEALLRASVVLQEALPVGLLDREEILAAVHEAYASVPAFYDPREYPIRYERELIPRLQALGCGANLLDLYCGHGREAEMFADAGFRVLGVDVLNEVIERARRYAQEAGFDAEFLTADVDRWEPETPGWDVVYSSLWMFSTIPDRSARHRWLERLSTWLAPDGLLVLSTTPRPGARKAAWRQRAARTVSIVSGNVRRPELGDRFHRELFWHDFEPAEVLEELSDAQLTVVDSLSIGGGTPCDFFVARRAGLLAQAAE